jgi:RNA polymerase sigma-70 factor (ECF subfamily)
MLAVALSRLGYGPDAEDAVQDAALVALGRLGELRDPQAAGPWLRAIVRNGCRMRLRAAPPASLPETALGRLPSGAPTPEEALDRQALRDWVWQALGELSEPLRLVVLLRYFSGVGAYAQIAALCGVPVGTVRSRLSEAKRRLAGALLAAAGQAHADAAALSAARRQEFVELLAAAERDPAAALAGRWAPDVAIVGPQGQRGRGPALLAAVMDSDLAAGVRQRPVNVVASGDLTIIEAALVNPPEDPDHCPPGVVWLQVLGGGRVRRLRLFHPHPAPTGTPPAPPA